MPGWKDTVDKRTTKPRRHEESHHEQTVSERGTGERARVLDKRNHGRVAHATIVGVAPKEKSYSFVSSCLRGYNPACTSVSPDLRSSRCRRTPRSFPFLPGRCPPMPEPQKVCRGRGKVRPRPRPMRHDPT